INPTIKLQWAEKNWTAEQLDYAKKCIQEAYLIAHKMFEHCRAMALSETQASRPISHRIVSIGSHTSKGAEAQLSGLARFEALARSLSSGSFDSDNSSSAVDEESTSSTVPNDDAHYRAVADKELDRWIALGIMTDARERAEYDPLIYWKV
ncbi:hypothetical protein H0H92_009037, partial [Tricholoma furcatifolium]